MAIKGTVTSGTGKGQIYVKEYAEELEKVLGFSPFHGTLNIRVKKKPNFEGYEKFSVREGQPNQVDCYLVTIADTYDGAIVLPHKTEHGNDIIEIIAAVDLRERLNLKDGDEVECGLE